MRCFFALELPEEIRAELARVSGRLRAIDAPVRWVKPENLHVTVKFLGECTPEQVEVLGKGMQLLDRPELCCRLSGLGSFPPRRPPRVVWAGLDGDLEGVARLAADVESLAATEGFAEERRPFRAHVTLGRVKKPRGARELTAAIDSLSDEVRSEGFAFPRLVLMESELTDEGSRYRVLYEV